MADAYASNGCHPYSGYMTSKGKVLHNLSGMDLIVDIAGMYFPLRTMQYAKNMNISDEHGTGSHDSYALTNQEHTYSVSFTYASYLVNGANIMTRAELLALTPALEKQADEGHVVYFDICPNRAKASGSWLMPCWPMGYVEALVGLQADQIWPGHTGEGLCGISKGVQVLPQTAAMIGDLIYHFWYVFSLS